MSDEQQTQENVQAEATPQAEPQAENVQEQPEIGAEVPADAQPVPEQQPESPASSPKNPDNSPAETPSVSEPVNQPEAPVEGESEENAPDGVAPEQTPAGTQQARPEGQELVFRYLYGVFHKSSDRVEAFDMEFLARSSKASETAGMCLKENVENPDDYTVRLKHIELVTVYRAQ